MYVRTLIRSLINQVEAARRGFLLPVRSPGKRRSGGDRMANPGGYWRDVTPVGAAAVAATATAATATATAGALTSPIPSPDGSFSRSAPFHFQFVFRFRSLNWAQLGVEPPWIDIMKREDGSKESVESTPSAESITITSHLISIKQIQFQ